MAEQLLSSTVLDNNFPSLGDLKGLVVVAVLLRLLGHQAHVAGVTHRGPVELAVLSAILQASRVGAGVAAVGDDALRHEKRKQCIAQIQSLPSYRNRWVDVAK